MATLVSATEERAFLLWVAEKARSAPPQKSGETAEERERGARCASKEILT